ncbi:hypothetical protein [Paraliobacillus sp. X-1268]|uniref:hypothetical protein n=1 Tax=Paraliobacillus sp. X-1268 TaxID=2213193 RepID=UPI000E3B75A0|nr:hypothetical protein [Paraliobacillus sp. X-1268]
MIGNIKSRAISKSKIRVISALLLLSIFLFVYFFNYNASTTYYETIEIRELNEDNNQYVVVLEGGFGVKKSNFTEYNTFNIIENEESRVGNINEIWNELSENESYFVLLKAYNNRNKFELESIYID